MIAFQVELPAPISAGDSIYLNILDEVTGLAMNPVSHVMQAEDDRRFIAILPFPVGTTLKYRYTRQGSSFAQEHLSDGRAVRYRLFHVEGPGYQQDVISRWTDTSFNSDTGRILGRVTEVQSGEPLPGILVTAGGAQTLTTSDGSYLLEGLPPGNHKIVAYALDGAYAVYQQGAVVAAGASTPAPLTLVPVPQVNVVFTVSVPQNTIPAVPVRIAGNLSQLGNTFGDLAGGVSTLAARMPVLSPLPDGRYSVTLTLPAGAHITYKYTLGDGLWNAEHSPNGEFRLRQMLVPAENKLIEDQVLTWTASEADPISFDVTVPPDTPAGDIVTIQFNPGFGWLEPVPMWKAGENRWIFILYSPIPQNSSLEYRYCRNGQCGSADDIRSMGQNASGLSVETQAGREIVDTVDSWAWSHVQAENITLPNVEIGNRGPGFRAGIEFQTGYTPSWEPYLAQSLQAVKQSQSNWVVLSPTWTFTRSNFPVFESVPGEDPLWRDIQAAVQGSHNLGINVALFPSPNFPSGAAAWWKEADSDFPWWVAFFERYESFAVHHADMAARQGVQALILGGAWLTPALPLGTQEGGAAPGLPLDADQRWRDIIGELRQHYSGPLFWALPFPQEGLQPPAFLDSVDEIYLLWSAPLATEPDASDTDLEIEAGLLLDDVVLPYLESFEKPVVLGVAYPSAVGGLTGCVSTSGTDCLPLEALSRPNPDVSAVKIAMVDQVKAYNAVLVAVNSRDWITGFISRGYYPPLPLLDKSISVHGKPAEQVLRYWFERFLGINS